jgi:O-methyltransferase
MPMNFRELVRRTVLSIPKIRELYKSNQKLSAKIEYLRANLSALKTRLVAAEKITEELNEGSNLAQLRTKYLFLLERALTGWLFSDEPISPWSKGYDPEARLIGKDWPSLAATMIGVVRMRNLRSLVENVLTNDVPGDLLEAGVWRGGACIYMRGILAAHNVTNRRVWVADSFCGLPPPDPDLYPGDRGDEHHKMRELAVPLEEVKNNFLRYDLLDDQVVFLPGWFKDTLASAPVNELAILRLDGDMYQSTIEALQALYHKLSIGGYVIIDDYSLEGARRAVHDFRERHGINEVICKIDWTGIYWRKET